MTGRCIADACALIAFFTRGDRSMSKTGLAAMRGDVAVSPVTVWELSRKVSLGKLPAFHFIGSISRWLAAQGLSLEPLSWADAERANSLPPLHKDPMDRMLIAQALNADVPVITSDALYARYGVRTIW